MLLIGDQSNDNSDNDRQLFANYANNPTLDPSTELDYETGNQNAVVRHLSSQAAVGYTGLFNLGNTCFMNSVIQTLSNTEEMRDYFTSGYYKEDINKENPLGTKGRIAEIFAKLLRNLWSGDLTAYSPVILKTMIGERINPVFSGYGQHDAQEYMAFLLDALHEDVNRIKMKPYLESNPEFDDNTPDEVLADEAWRIYRTRNDSIVVDLFQGQYKSKLTCPDCHKVSITFDPFLYLSVPMPKNIIRTVYFFPRDTSKKPIKHLVMLPVDAKISVLLETLSNRTDVNKNDLRFVTVSDGKIKYIHEPRDDGSVTSNNDMLLVFELMSKDTSGDEEMYEFAVHQRLAVPNQTMRCSNCGKKSTTGSTASLRDNDEILKLKKCTKCYRALYCHKECQGQHWQKHKPVCSFRAELVGCPFIFTLPKSKCTFSQLTDVLAQYSRYSVDIYDPPSCSSSGHPQPTRKDSFSSMSSSDDSSVESHTLAKERFKLKQYNDLSSISEVGDELKASYDENGHELGESVIANDDSRKRYYLSIDWANNECHKEYVVVESKDLDHNYDIIEGEQTQRGLNSFTLHQCLTLFTEPEILTPEEAWYCPRCKAHRRATKQMTLWRLPGILIIQLKRFSFKNLLFRDKIDKFVKFPTRGLDLSEFCCNQSSTASNSNITNCNSNNPSQRPIYDLYGVINHMGGLFGGHYITSAKTTHDKIKYDWRSFDDSHVSDISEDDVVTKNAYILFYRLREAS